MSEQFAVEMQGIVKTFPGIVACDNVSLEIRKGEIHALLGENGAGKSTLMSILFGMYQPEAGVIKVNGKEVHITWRCQAECSRICSSRTWSFRNSKTTTLPYSPIP